MKQFLQFSVLGLCCLLLFGCPYEASIPISKPEQPVDNRLVGEWMCEDELYNRYTIRQAASNFYSVEQRSPAGTYKYRAHLSEIKGVSFLNLFSDSSKVYYFYRVKMDSAAKSFSLMPVAARPELELSSSAALQAYFQKNMNLQSFYEDDKLVFRQVTSENAASAHQ